jgi:hypothetical protein
MARSEARLFTDIWDDSDFLAATPGEQRLYMFLLSQNDLTHAGVIPLRAQRWARKSPGLTTAGIEEQLRGLAERRFLVVDLDTGEVLVRALIRRDKIYRQPNVMKAAIDYIPLIESQPILRALAAELQRVRVDDPELTPPMLATLGAMENALAARVTHEPDPEPEKAAQNPSGNPSANGSGNPSEKASGKGPRGTGSVTTVTTDSPFPDSPLIPPPAEDASRPRAELAIVPNLGPEPRTTQELVAWWIDQCNVRPDRSTIGQISKHIKALLDQGFEPVHIRRGLTEWHAKEVHPSVLPSIVTHTANRRAPIRAAPKPSTTDSRVLDALALAERQEAQARGGTG